MAGKTLSLYRVTRAAELCGIGQTRLAKAIKRGHVRYTSTACGLPLVRIRDVQAYLDYPPKKGRPKTRSK